MEKVLSRKVGGAKLLTRYIAKTIVTNEKKNSKTEKRIYFSMTN